MGGRAASRRHNPGVAPAKARTYPELAQGNGCRLVVLGIEVGGEWSPQG